LESVRACGLCPLGFDFFLALILGGMRSFGHLESIQAGLETIESAFASAKVYQCDGQKVYHPRARFLPRILSL